MSTREDDARRGAETIEASGGRVIAEVRDLLQRIRSHADPSSAGRLDTLTPAEAPLTALIERAQRAGLAVTSHRRGLVQAEAGPLTEVTYRIVQEGLTNGTRNAPGSQVAVAIDHQPSQTIVEVRNNAPTTL